MRRKNIVKFLESFLLIMLSLNTNVALASHDTITLGGIAGNIHGSASILTRVMWAACIIVGVFLFITAFSQFQTHRRNPKLVPLTTPILYLILALTSIAIPFAENIFKFEDSYEEAEQHNHDVENPYVDIDR